MLVSPTEPQRLRHLGSTSSQPEKHGADFLILGKTYRIGVQRKQFPGDLLSSIADGRLYSQLPYLAELEQAMVLVEGYGKWTEDGELIGPIDYQRFTRTQMYGLFNSIMFEFGVPVYQVKNIDATEDYLIALEAWASKTKHSSLKTRPGPSGDSWGTSDRHFAMHMLQGLPGVGPELAGRMIDHFGTLPLSWDVSYDELLKVPGVGPKKAVAMYEALDFGEDE